MFRRSLRQRRPFQSEDSGECWRSSASAAGKLHKNNHLSRSYHNWRCDCVVSKIADVSLDADSCKTDVRPETEMLFKTSQTCTLKTASCIFVNPPEATEDRQQLSALRIL